jgi:hypothetical protein
MFGQSEFFNTIDPFRNEAAARKSQNASKQRSYTVSFCRTFQRGSHVRDEINDAVIE